MLESPEYKAVSENSAPEDRLNMGIAASMAKQIPSNATPERLDAFADALRRRLPGEAHGDYISVGVDYGPDKILSDAAEDAGLDMQFPWKTQMWISHGTVSVSAGYGAPQVFHHPMADGRWLVTTLYGSDIDKVIALVERGVDTGLAIE